MDELDFEKLVLATTTAGEKMVGTHDYPTRTLFEEDAKKGLAVRLRDVRNLAVQEVQKDGGNGQTMVGLSIALLALPPFTFPVPVHWVRLAGWVYIGDHSDLLPDISILMAQAERRETEMRASRSGITLAGNKIPPNIRG